MSILITITECPLFFLDIFSFIQPCWIIRIYFVHKLWSPHWIYDCYTFWIAHHWYFVMSSWYGSRNEMGWSSHMGPNRGPPSYQFGPRIRLNNPRIRIHPFLFEPSKSVNANCGLKSFLELTISELWTDNLVFSKLRTDDLVFSELMT